MRRREVANFRASGVPLDIQYNPSRNPNAVNVRRRNDSGSGQVTAGGYASKVNDIGLLGEGHTNEGQPSVHQPNESEPSTETADRVSMIRNINRHNQEQNMGEYYPLLEDSTEVNHLPPRKRPKNRSVAKETKTKRNAPASKATRRKSTAARSTGRDAMNSTNGRTGKLLGTRGNNNTRKRAGSSTGAIASKKRKRVVKQEPEPAPASGPSQVNAAKRRKIAVKQEPELEPEPASAPVSAPGPSRANAPKRGRTVQKEEPELVSEPQNQAGRSGETTSEMTEVSGTEQRAVETSKSRGRQRARKARRVRKVLTSSDPSALTCVLQQIRNFMDRVAATLGTYDDSAEPIRRRPASLQRRYVISPCVLQYLYISWRDKRAAPLVIPREDQAIKEIVTQPSTVITLCATDFAPVAWLLNAFSDQQLNYVKKMETRTMEFILANRNIAEFKNWMGDEFFSNSKT